MGPFFHQPELNDGNNAKGQKDKDGHGRGVRTVEIGKCHFPNPVQDQFGRIVRPALGQDEQMVDQFDRIDHCIDEHKDRGWHQKRQ